MVIVQKASEKVDGINCKPLNVLHFNTETVGNDKTESTKKAAQEGEKKKKKKATLAYFF